jgi:pimeloyl-ACP methyl ester carboxylesterase
VESISRIDAQSSISTFIWETREVSDLFRVLTSGVVLNPLHPLSLGYKVDRIMEIWNNAKVNSALYAKVLLDDIDNLLSRSTGRKHITLIGHSLGSRLVFNSMQNAEKGMVERIFFVGGAVGINNNWDALTSLVDMIVNCYTSRDGVLKFLYAIAEKGEKPIGLQRIDHDTDKTHNIDCSAWVKGHTRYNRAVEHWFKVAVKDSSTE